MASVSLTVSSGKSRASWNERPSPARARPAELSDVTSRPASMIRPACNGVKPEMRSNIVVLPAPFGPMMPTISPAPTSNVTPSTARMPPKLTDNPSTLNTGTASASCTYRWRTLAPDPFVESRWPSSRRRRRRRRRGQEHRAQQVGTIEQLGGGATEADLAALHEVRPVGDGERDVHALLDEHHRHAVGGHALDDRQELADDHRREPERQLVDQQHLGPHDEAHREREHLLLAAGQVGGGRVEPLAEDREGLDAPRRWPP